MIEAMGLKLLHRVHTKFHENVPSGSDVISGGQTDKQTGDLISLLSFFRK
jgi:hypothetical protein